MPNQLTDAQRDADHCPDCEHDAADDSLHAATCRRVCMGMPVDANGPDRSKWPDPWLDLQSGPPWADWPVGVEPVNPLAQAH